MSVPPVHGVQSSERPFKRLADIHCHCLCGFDDGPGTMEESIALCATQAAGGITDVVATPHQLGRYDGRNSVASIREGVASLNAALTVQEIPVRVWAGAEIRLDERIGKLLAQGALMTVGDSTTHILVDLPTDTFVDVRPLLLDLRAAGVSTVIAHPERNDVLARNDRAVTGMVGCGALLQITAGSLLGDFGRRAEEAAWRWLYEGLVTLVASDAHDPHARPPRMGAALRAVTARMGFPVAYRVCVRNPLDVLAAGRPLPVGVEATGAVP